MNEELPTCERQDLAGRWTFDIACLMIISAIFVLIAHARDFSSLFALGAVLLNGPAILLCVFWDNDFTPIVFWSGWLAQWILVWFGGLGVLMDTRSGVMAWAVIIAYVVLFGGPAFFGLLTLISF